MDYKILPLNFSIIKFVFFNSLDHLKLGLVSKTIEIELESFN